MKYAQPGDSDLDIDIDGITLTAVVVDEQEILLRGEGGFGEFLSTQGERALFRPGEADEGVEEMEAHLYFPAVPSRLFDKLVDRLEDWRDRAVPLRLCGAPGRMFTLIENEARWLPLPRAQWEELTVPD